MRSIQARSSSSERALASESIGCRCVTFSSLPTGSPPTRCVGRVRRQQLRVLALDRAQLVQQRVVGVVADLRVVEDVVAVPVVGELLAQLGARAPPARHRSPEQLGEVVLAQALHPVLGGEVEVQRRDGDAAGRDGGEVGAGLVVVDGRVAVDAEEPAAADVLLDQLELVLVDALAQPGDLDTADVARGDVDVEQRARRERDVVEPVDDPCGERGRVARSRTGCPSRKSISRARRLLRDGDAGNPQHDALQRRRDGARCR